ncbi:MAG: 3'-5' exonuclease [Aureliella sp.]
MPTLNGNLLVSVDLESTGPDPDRHEIIQLAMLPLGHDLEPVTGIRPFYTNIAPMHPETVDPESTAVHGLDLDDLLLHAPSSDRVLEKFYKWFEGLELAFDRRLVMLAHNCPFESKFLSKWLGQKGYDRFFNHQTRDSMHFASALNDMAFQRGCKPPFERVSLAWLSNHFGIVNERAHDALADAVVCAKVYKKLLQTDIIL